MYYLPSIVVSYLPKWRRGCPVVKVRRLVEYGALKRRVEVGELPSFCNCVRKFQKFIDARWCSLGGKVQNMLCYLSRLDLSWFGTREFNNSLYPRAGEMTSANEVSKTSYIWLYLLECIPCFMTVPAYFLVRMLRCIWPLTSPNRNVTCIKILMMELSIRVSQFLIHSTFVLVNLACIPLFVWSSAIPNGLRWTLNHNR